MFVTGCHRSGTSLLASLVRGLIACETEPCQELPPALDNPRGFQESKSLNRLNNRLLELAGCRWDQPPLTMPDWSSAPFFQELFDARDDFSELALKRDWVEKNPRLCLTAEAMQHLLLRRVPLVAVLREPQAVAVSLFRRNGLPLEQGLLIWYLYNHHLASVLQADDLLLTYSDLKAGGEAVLSTLADHLSQHGFSVVEQDSRVLHQQIDPHLDRAGGQARSLVGQAADLLDTCLDCYQRCTAPAAGMTAFRDVFAGFPAALLSALAERGVWQWQIGD